MNNKLFNISASILQQSVFLFLFALLFGLSSCLKEDEKLPKPDIKSITRTIDNIKVNQVYYSLKDSSVVASNKTTDWDLRFDCNDHFNIWLNSARIMYVADAGIKDMNELENIDGLSFKFDFPSGSPDSNAIHEWGDFSLAKPNSYLHTYVLFLGQNENGDSLGFIKFQIINYSSDGYTIAFNDLSDVSSPAKTLVVPKNNDYNYTYISFKETGSIVQIEPKKTDWDLWFTQYTAWVYNFADGIYYPYQVGGCLINPYETSVAYDTSDRFQEIDILEAQSMNYHRNWDIIGYGWKSFSGIGSGVGEYTIYSNVTYVLKNAREEYYKIRFIDYYNTARQSGYPKFEQLQI